jgi:hypothetical protein
MRQLSLKVNTTNTGHDRVYANTVPTLATINFEEKGNVQTVVAPGEFAKGADGDCFGWTFPIFKSIMGTGSGADFSFALASLMLRSDIKRPMGLIELKPPDLV